MVDFFWFGLVGDDGGGFFKFYFDIRILTSKKNNSLIIHSVRKFKAVLGFLFLSMQSLRLHLEPVFHDYHFSRL